MDLSHALDAHADAVAAEAPDRLASDANKSLLRERVTHGRRTRSFNVATGVAAGAAILMVAGAWAGPQLFAQPTQIAPIAPPSAVPSSTPSPTPTIETYVATPFIQLARPGEVGYVTPMLGAYRSQNSVQCKDMTSVPMSTQGSPFPGYVSGMPTWLMPQLMYESEPIPLYYATSPEYGFLVTSMSQLYPPDSVNTVALINPEGGWWAFTAAYTEITNSELHPDGMYLKLFLDQACGGGDRTYGGPMPPGIYQARELTAAQAGNGPSVVRDLGPVEVRPWSTIDVTPTP